MLGAASELARFIITLQLLLEFTRLTLKPLLSLAGVQCALGRHLRPAAWNQEPPLINDLSYQCCATRYTGPMIKSFKHKGLEKFYETGNMRGIQADRAKKLRLQLAALDSAQTIDDTDLPGYRLHPLKGDIKGLWSITVNGNWRITFDFKDSNTYIVNYEDYH